MARIKALVSCSLTLAALALPAVLTGCEVQTPAEPMASHDETLPNLQGGMGLLEVEHALGSSGTPQDWGRRVEAPSEDPEDWSAEWRQSRVYELESETQVVAVFTAWASEDNTSTPPESAYRLVSWAPKTSQATSTDRLWGTQH